MNIISPFDMYIICKKYLNTKTFNILLKFEQSRSDNIKESLFEHSCKTANAFNKNMYENHRNIFNDFNDIVIDFNNIKINFFQFIGMFHDIGKAFSTNNYIAHASIGAQIVYDNFKNELKKYILEDICWFINYHMCKIQKSCVYNTLYYTTRSYNTKHIILKELIDADFNSRTLLHGELIEKFIIPKTVLINKDFIFDNIIVYISTDYIKKQQYEFFNRYIVERKKINDVDELENINNTLIFVSTFELYKKLVKKYKEIKCNILKIVQYKFLTSITSKTYYTTSNNQVFPTYYEYCNKRNNITRNPNTFHISFVFFKELEYFVYNYFKKHKWKKLCILDQ